jgi:hypothetical protein
MKGNRIKIENETTPVTETQQLTDGTYQFRYDFTEVEATDETPASFNYAYVNVPNTSRGTIITAIIRTRYSADQEAAIVRKKQANEDVIDFLKYNNFANYAKAAADGNDLSEFKQKTVYEITIPLAITLAGGDYEPLSDKSIKLNIPFESNSVEGYAKAYPSWLDETDQQAIEGDPRVEIQQVNIY